MSNETDSSQGFDRAEPNVGGIAAVGAITVVSLVAILFGLQYFFDRSLEQQVFVKVLAPESQSLRDLKAHENEELHSYRYIDRDKGIIRLPIERAMELVASEAAKGGSHAGR
jgi:hypothetical protein